VNIPEYEYTIEQCDVPEVRRGVLREYQQFRRKCLEYLRGDADTSVMNRYTAWLGIPPRFARSTKRVALSRIAR
jgi:hypothetical protein